MNILKRFFRYPWAIIITCVAITGFFGLFIPRLQMDNSLRQFFPQKDESYDRMNATEDTFGSMLSIGVIIDAKDGTILTPEYLGVIKKISDQVELLDNVENVKSVNCKVKLDKAINNVVIDMNLVVTSETIIKELSADLQRKIKEIIKKTTEIDVKAINVRIKNIETQKTV